MKIRVGDIVQYADFLGIVIGTRQGIGMPALIVLIDWEKRVSYGNSYCVTWQNPKVLFPDEVKVWERNYGEIPKDWQRLIDCSKNVGFRIPFKLIEPDVIVTDFTGREIGRFHGPLEAAKATGQNKGNVCNCLKGRIPSIGGYRFSYPEVYQYFNEDERRIA